MRLLSLENFAVIDIPKNPDDEEKPQKWTVVGVAAYRGDKKKWFSDGTPDHRRLQAILQDGHEFASIDFQTFKISRLDAVSTFSQRCMALSICPDGQTMYGIEWSGAFFALCNNLKHKKYIRERFKMKIGKQKGLYERTMSAVRDFLGYAEEIPSLLVNSKLSELEQFENLFPILKPTGDGLALLCITRPEELFLYICTYSTALRHKHMSQVVNYTKRYQDRLYGQWWRIFMDEEIILNWLVDKGVPVVSSGIAHTKSRDIRGAVVYSAFVDRSLEMLYGLFDKPDMKYQLKWGLIGYEFDWITSENETEIPVGKKNFISKLSSNTDKIAIAVNTYMGVYISVQELPGSESKVKLDRMTVPICAHCDYGSVLYYDEECWVSSIEWLSEDCYFACTTRCGCLSVFYKTGEPMVLNIRKHEDPVKDPPCNFYQQIFDTRSKKEKKKFDELNANEEIKLLPRIQLKWSGPPENVLVVFSETKLCFFAIKRVSNYIEISDIKIPTPEDLVNIRNSSAPQQTLTGPTVSDMKLLMDETRFKNCERNFMKDINANAGENFASDDRTFLKDFADNLPQAEIILRPVIITSDLDKKQRTVNFKFHNQNDPNDVFESKVLSDEQLYLNNRSSAAEDNLANDLDRITLSLPDLETTFDLTKRSPLQYMADDERTEAESRGKNRHETPEPQFRPEYPDGYHSSEEYCTYANVTAYSDSGYNGLEVESHNSYSPPFTDDSDDEDEKNDKEIHSKSSRKPKDQQTDYCMLSMPKVPHIDSVIPFVSRTPCEELSSSSILSSVHVQPICATSSTQTEYEECNNTSDIGSQCRPDCVVTEPSPPSMSPSRAHSTISCKNSIDASEGLHFINDIDDDQLHACPVDLEYSSGKTENEEDFDNNNTGSIPDGTGSPPSQLLFNLDGSAIDRETAKESEDSSRKIWEQVSGRFGKKPLTRRNFLRKHFNTDSVGTSPRVNVEEENYLPCDKPTKAANNEVYQNSSKSEKSTSTKKNIIKSILKASTGNEFTPEATKIDKSSPVIYAGKSLPTEASDSMLLESLKKKLHSLKQRQEDNKPKNKNNRGLSKFMSDWMNSSEDLPLTKQETEQLMRINNKEVRLQAVSQPNFRAQLSNPGLRKANFSEPQLTTRKRVNGSSINSQIRIKSPSTKRPSSSKKSEFTIGPPSSNPTQIKTKLKKKTTTANSKLQINAEAVSKKSDPVIKPVTAAYSIPSISPKFQTSTASGALIKRSAPNVTFPFLVSSSSRRKTQITKPSGDIEKVIRPTSCPSGLLGSSINKVVSKKSQPSLPVRKKSKNNTLKKKPSINAGPIRPTFAEQREEEIKQLKTSLMRLTQAYGPLGPKAYSEKSVSQCNSKPSSPSPVSRSPRSSRKPSASPSENSSTKTMPNRSPSKSPTRPQTTMEEIKQQMLEELKYEIQRPSTVPSDDSVSDDEEASASVSHQSIGKGLTIHTEVMEYVPLRPFYHKIIDEVGGGLYPSASERMQRRVSFSDPIAVFKTMSPPSLLKSDGYVEVEDEDEIERLQLRRIQKQVFDF